MKCLTIRQPYASLVAAGVKTIETRSWRTSYRGRIAIHAAARPMDDGGFKLMLAAGVSPSAALTAYSTNPDYGIPRGAVVATAELVDCVPMVGNGVDFGDPDALNVPWGFYGHEGRVPNLPLELCQRVDRHNYRITDVTEQEPFGDFAPGRWAWLLDDIKPVNERCPWCWGARFACPQHGRSAKCRHGTAPTCHVCDGRGACDPIPARGQQGLWNWEPEATHATPTKETQ